MLTDASEGEAGFEPGKGVVQQDTWKDASRWKRVSVDLFSLLEALSRC